MRGIRLKLVDLRVGETRDGAAVDVETNRAPVGT